MFIELSVEEGMLIFPLVILLAVRCYCVFAGVLMANNIKLGCQVINTNQHEL